MPNNTLQHLGIPQLSRKQMALEISERVRCARLWCQRHWPMLCDPEMHSRTKFQLYKFFVKPILTYGCELWTLDDRNSKKLVRFECSILLEIYKSKYPHRHPKRLRPNMRAVYRRYRGTDVLEHVNNERLRWQELLNNEERALNRNHNRREQSVHWGDHTRPKPTSALRQLTIEGCSGVIVCESSVEPTSSRSKSIDDAPG